MATLICNNSGNLTGAATFAAAEVGAGSLNLVRNTTTTSGGVTSATFTVTSGKIIDAVLLYCGAGGASATGTLKVDLQKGGVSQASVTVNKVDLPAQTLLPMCPVLFKLTSTATGDGGSNWTIVLTVTGNSLTYALHTAGVTNITRALRTTTAATAAAADDLYIVGELTGAGTNTPRTVTMDSTAATAYGNGTLNTNTVAGGGIHISCYGTLSYGTAVSTNYVLRVNGDLIVYQFGTLNIVQNLNLPASLTGLIGWWDASVTASLTLSGTDILNVADQSGGSNGLTWTGFAKPIYNATGFNSKPAFTFNGSLANAFTNTSFPLGTGNTLTCWYVGNLTSATAYTDAGIISYTGAGQAADWQNLGSFVVSRPGSSATNQQITRNVVIANVPCSANANHRVIATINSSGVMTMYIDGVAQTPNTCSGNWTSPGTLNIGRSQGAAYWSGPVGEIGIATDYSDATTVAQLDIYLKNKWGL